MGTFSQTGTRRLTNKIEKPSQKQHKNKLTKTPSSVDSDLDFCNVCGQYQIADLCPCIPEYRGSRLDPEFNKVSFDSFYLTSSSRKPKPKAAKNDSCQKRPPRCSRDSLPKPHTAPWIVRRVREDSSEEAQTVLKLWMRKQRHSEINEGLV